MRRGRNLTSEDDRRSDIELLLRAKRAELAEDHQRCLAILREPVAIDFDNGGASDPEDRTDAAAMVDHLAREIRAIDDALARLVRGGYGVCITCNHRIPRGRLAAQPTALRCLQCQALAERKVG